MCRRIYIVRPIKMALTRRRELSGEPVEFVTHLHAPKFSCLAIVELPTALFGVDQHIRPRSLHADP
jgi:hypothetical protein